MKKDRELCSTFLNYIFIKCDLIYGNAWRYWWKDEGEILFYKWAEKEGLEFSEKDFKMEFFKIKEKK